MAPVADRLEVDVPVGGRVLVVSELLLGPSTSSAGDAASIDVAAAVEAADGPGVVVLAGNTFDFTVAGEVTPSRALAGHPRLAAALREFGRSGGRVILVPGSRDRRLAFDVGYAADACTQLGAELALAVDLHIATGAGSHDVRVEAGRRFDDSFAVDDARNGAESPLGEHVLAEILPRFRSPWSDGIERVGDLSSIPQFVGSRTLYRRVLGWSWLLLVPFAMAVLVKVPLSFVLAGRLDRALGSWTERIQLLTVAAAVDVLVVAALAVSVLSGAWRRIVDGGDRPRPANEAARTEAQRLVAAGYRAVVVGGGAAELTYWRDAAFAATGPCGDTIERRPGRFGLPAVFVPVRVVSWVEIEAGADVHVRLWHSASDRPGATLAERVAGGGGEHRPRPAIVATFPGETSWPAALGHGARLRRVRRRASAAIALAGALDVASALTPPLEARLDSLIDLVPLAVPEAASALVAIAGVALLALAQGVRRGQRRAQRVALALLVGSVVLHLVKGVDVEEALAAAVVAGYLFVQRDAFTAGAHAGARRDALRLVGAAAGVVVAAVAAVEATTAARGRRVALGHAAVAVAGRLVGFHAAALPRRVDQFASPVLLALGVGFAGALCWLLLRPAATRRSNADERKRARLVVRASGEGTLDYFALRDDKQLYFSGESVVAYAVHHDVCLVSPDPVGPAWERAGVWDDFHRFADGHGWTLGVLGAGDEWLAVYRAAGMHDLYVGDEAVVDLSRFSLDGGRHKGLRQAVNRIAKYGYTVSFHDPADPPPGIESAVRAVVTKSRRGDVERGFSMTLGRIFDRRDLGLLLAVAHDPAGVPVAFCQFVPAPGIGGYSLDLMRRDDGDHPNGLVDFVLVETIRHLRDEGYRHLSLNFAAMRAVLAGQTGAGIRARIERWALRAASGPMQIESLWRFNAKFDPVWQPRHLVYDSPEHLMSVAFAVARAESFWELPLIGRFLVPATDDRAGVDRAGAGADAVGAAPPRG